MKVRFVGNGFSFKYDDLKDDRRMGDFSTDPKYLSQTVELYYKGKYITSTEVDMDTERCGSFGMDNFIYKVNTSPKDLEFLCKVLATYEDVLDRLKFDYNNEKLLEQKKTIEAYLKGDRSKKDYIVSIFDDNNIQIKLQEGARLTNKHEILKAKKDARKAKMAKVADIIKTPFKVLKAKTDEIKESIKKSREERAKKISARTPFER